MKKGHEYMGRLTQTELWRTIGLCSDQLRSSNDRSDHVRETGVWVGDFCEGKTTKSRNMSNVFPELKVLIVATLHQFAKLSL